MIWKPKGLIAYRLNALGRSTKLVYLPSILNVPVGANSLFADPLVRSAVTLGARQMHSYGEIRGFHEVAGEASSVATGRERAP